jgi:predicted TIM-barrel fold metal-dependent hydrolase
MAMMQIERSGWLSRRALPRLLFAGVFERHPRLRYVLTEQNGEWWAATMREYDSAYVAYRWQFAEQVPKKPSEYCATNVYIGGSYIAPFEVEMAVRDGYAANVMWGSDYPHAEGTYQWSEHAAGETSTHQALRYAFADADPAVTRAMLGATAVECFGFDSTALRRVADRIAAPTLAELAVPLEQIPEWTASKAFRTVGPFG